MHRHPQHQREWEVGASDWGDETGDGVAAQQTRAVGVRVRPGKWWQRPVSCVRCFSRKVVSDSL